MTQAEYEAIREYLDDLNETVRFRDQKKLDYLVKLVKKDWERQNRQVLHDHGYGRESMQKCELVNMVRYLQSIKDGRLNEISVIKKTIDDYTKIIGMHQEIVEETDKYLRLLNALLKEWEYIEEVVRKSKESQDG